MHLIDLRRLSIRARLAVATAFAVSLSGVMGWAIITNLTLVSQLHQPQAEHVNQADLMALVNAGQDDEAFDAAFEGGDELFETVFNALDGVGANVGKGQRFTRVPRADLSEWASNIPSRATGPNAQSCNSCHSLPTDDGAGPAAANVHRDPNHTGSLAAMIQRNTPHTFGMGGVQRLAEEMTATLQGILAQAKQQACSSGHSVTKNLVAKNVNFGKVKVTPSGNPCQPIVDTSDVEGVAIDLVVRPFQWKGSVAFVRDFNRDASHNELGMQAVEIVGDGVDGDGDGIANEMTVGDQTALAVYLSAQPRPTSKVELSALGLIPPLSGAELQSIGKGAIAFGQAGCAVCHIPFLRADDRIFREPSSNPNFRDSMFPAGQNPIAMGVNPAKPVKFDLTKDQPDNQIKDANGHVTFRLGSFQKDFTGKVIVSLFGDLKRHDMGPGLAEQIDEVGTGSSVFLTENLWGVGTTAPYLHDGRATTLTEAILEHGGEASSAKAAFEALPLGSKKDLIAFLDNLVLFKIPD